MLQINNMFSLEQTFEDVLDNVLKKIKGKGNLKIYLFFLGYTPTYKFITLFIAYFG